MIDIQQLRPKLKSSLRFVLESFGEHACCMLEDPERGQFWRIGLSEFQFLSLLDGDRTVAEAADRLRDEAGQPLLEPAELPQVVGWLIQEGLAENLSARNQKSQPAKLVRGLNASVFFRCKLGNPQSLLERLFPLLGWLTSPWLCGVWLATLVTATLLIAGRWGAFQSATFNVIATDQWLYFLIIWWGLKLIHELFHGLTCVRYGGTVREAGILFLLFAPLGAYVDVTSAWRFSSKWQRIHVTLAGIYVELFVAACAVIVWCFSPDLFVRQLCLQVVLLASLATLLFNGNPLIRFDGYYVLADLLELPNLYVRGQLAVRRLFGRIFFGRAASVGSQEAHHRLFVLGFGLACFAWKIVLCVGIVLAAAVLFQGAGIVLALALAFVWIVLPTGKLLVRCARMIPRRPFAIIRAVVVLAALIATSTWIARSVAIPRLVTAPGIVRPIETTIVRAGASGWLDELDVTSGQEVAAGQLLARLRNPELNVEILELRQELKRTEARHRRFLSDGRIGEAKAETEVLKQLQSQLQERLDRRAQLEVHAPHAGVVLDFDLDSVNGTYLERGDRLFDLADPTVLEFAFSLEQSQNDRLQRIDAEQPVVTVFMPGRTPIQLDPQSLAVHPQASWRLDAPALAADHGGPIPVMEVALGQQRVETRTLRPRIHGTLSLPQCDDLLPGTLGTVRLSGKNHTLAEQLTPWLKQLYHRLADRLGEVRTVAGPTS